MPNLVEQVIRPEILRLSPYHVPSSSGMIKLDAMENPYSLPEALQEEIAQLLQLFQPIVILTQTLFH